MATLLTIFGSWRAIGIGLAVAVILGAVAWVAHLHGRVGELQVQVAAATEAAQQSQAAVVELRAEAARQVAALQAQQADTARIAAASTRIAKEISGVPPQTLDAAAVRALRMLDSAYHRPAAPAGAK